MRWTSNWMANRQNATMITSTGSEVAGWQGERRQPQADKGAGGPFEAALHRTPLVQSLTEHQHGGGHGPEAVAEPESDPDRPGQCRPDRDPDDHQ